MSDSTTNFGGAPKLCTDCTETLSAKELDHGLEGFGHQGRCCDCYDAHCMNVSKKTITDADALNRKRLREREEIKTEVYLPPEFTADYVSFQTPIGVRYKTYVDEDGSWVARVDVEAFDVSAGDIRHFKTTWRGRRPDTERGEREVIALTIKNALAHEVQEQLGLDPHSQAPYGHGCTDGRHAAGCACRTEDL